MLLVTAGPWAVAPLIGWKPLEIAISDHFDGAISESQSQPTLPCLPTPRGAAAVKLRPVHLPSARNPNQFHKSKTPIYPR